MVLTRGMYIVNTCSTVVEETSAVHMLCPINGQILVTGDVNKQSNDTDCLEQKFDNQLKSTDDVGKQMDGYDDHLGAQR